MFNSYCFYDAIGIRQLTRISTGMSKFDVLVTRRLPSSALEILKKSCNVDLWDSDDVISRSTLLQKVKDKAGVLCLLTDKIDKEVLNVAGKNLRVLSTMSVGVDHVNLSECSERGILLGYTPDILTDATAELTVGLLLATTRRIVEGTKVVRNGEWGTWKPMWMCGSTLGGSTVGFFGLGRIGLAVLERLRPFGVSSFLYNTVNRKSHDFEQEINATWVSFDKLLEKSDFVIACCALTPQTTGIFNRKSFQSMKSSAVFINISRGAVVQQDDLVDSLRNGEIRAAGLDVTTPEPLPTDHPLLGLDNCVVLPHIGSATDVTRTKMAELAALNLVNGLAEEKMPARYSLPG